MRTSLMATLPLVLLAGCQTARPLGDDVTHNIAAQVVDVSPVQAGRPIEGGHARPRVANVQRTMRGGAPTSQIGATTSAVGGGGSGGGAAAPQ